MNEKTETLWCMHVLGPDDVHAAPSKEAAQRACDRYYAHFGDQYPDVLLRFVVAEWPHSPESHAEDLKRWDTEISPPPPNKS